MTYGKWSDWKEVVREKVTSLGGGKILGIVVQFDLFPAFDELVVHTEDGTLFSALLNAGLSELVFKKIEKKKGEVK